MIDPSILLRPPQNDAEWTAYYELRWRILREPWQQPRGSERDELEHAALQLAAWDTQGKILGVARLHRENDHGIIRYMAVLPARQRRGIGGALLERLEQQARDWQLTAILLNARDAYRDFYRQMGYEIVGPGPTLFDVITHSRMRKRLK